MNDVMLLNSANNHFMDMLYIFSFANIPVIFLNLFLEYLIEPVTMDFLCAWLRLCIEVFWVLHPDVQVVFDGVGFDIITFEINF